jgi:hypothetical protein
MNKISARDIRVFVAGALALDGFDSLIRAPFILFSSHTNFATSIILISTHLILSLTLVLAIGLLNGNTRALMWTKAVLSIVIVYECVYVVVNFVSPSSNASTQPLSIVPGLFAWIALLGLLYWSDSKSLKDKPAGENPNQTATESD